MKKINWLFIGVGISILIISIIFLSKELIHIIYEIFAIPFGIYFIWYGVVKAKGINKYIFIIFGAGNIIIDGYLLLRNLFAGGGI